MKYISSVLIIALIILWFPQEAHAATDIVNDVTLSTSLISCWSMDEASTGAGAVTRYDSEPTNPNDLTDNNTTPSATGLYSNAASTTRTSQEYLSKSSPSNMFSGDGDRSVSMWVKFSSLPQSGANTRLMFGSGNQASNQEWSWGIYWNTGIYYYADRYGSNINGSTDLTSYVPVNTWIHMVVTHTDADRTDRIYFNGTLRESSTWGVDLNTGTGQVVIGARLGNLSAAESHNGLMDEVAIWSRVLDTTDISNLYAGGAGIPCVSSAEPVVTVYPKTVIQGDVSFGGDVVIQ